MLSDVNGLNSIFLGKTVIVESDHKPLQSIFKKPIHAAPCRVQQMLLRLLRYNLDVQYKPGRLMFIADHLSRASTSEVELEQDEAQVFAMEVERMDPFDTIKVAPEKLTQLQRCTGQDHILQTLKTTVLSGWPEHREKVPVPIRDFWSYGEEISIHNGVLFKSHRVIIPTVMRAEILSKIHSSHMGIEYCLRKAKDIVFWPGMSTHIKEIVASCQVCAEFQTRKHFSRHGIPDCLITDNSSQLVSREFTPFVFEWEVNHVTSSPHHPKANSKAESAVKIAKGLFKKAQKSGKDPWLALLDERNTPLEGLETSPAQRLMSRRTRRQLPTATSLLYPKVVDRVQEKIKLKRQRAKAYYDRTAKVLRELEVGQEVRKLERIRKLHHSTRARHGRQQPVYSNCQTIPTWCKEARKQCEETEKH